MRIILSWLFSIWLIVAAMLAVSHQTTKDICPDTADIRPVAFLLWPVVLFDIVFLGWQSEESLQCVGELK